MDLNAACSVEPGAWRGHCGLAFLLSVLPCLIPVASVGAADLLSISVKHEGARYHLESDTHFDAPPSAIFQVMTDFEHLDRVSKTIIESHYIEPDEDGTPLVFTRVRGCAMFICRSLIRVERLTLEAPYHIVTTAIPERSNVRFSESEWQLRDDDNGGTRVSYSLELEPGFWVPPLIGPLIIKRMLIKDGAEVAAKIEAMAARLSSQDGTD